MAEALLPWLCWGTLDSAGGGEVCVSTHLSAFIHARPPLRGTLEGSDTCQRASADASVAGVEKLLFQPSHFAGG